jgi:hypothetical protein
MHDFSARASVIVLMAGMASAALAQTAPLQSVEVPWPLDSGPLVARADRQVAYRTVLSRPGSPWLRISFAKTELRGVIEEGSGAFLRMTSLQDGAVQYLDAASLDQWANTSAYFNGDSVLIEVVAFTGAPASRLRIKSIIAGLPIQGGPDSLCGVDDRQLSTDPRSARHVPEGCTTWLFNDTNHMFLTAGHCGISSGDVQQFNVPLSTSTGALVAPPPEHQYSVDPASVRSNGGGGIGNDFCYFGCFVNSNTGLTAYQRQGAHYTIATSVPAVAGQNIRIIGYGTTGSPVSPTFNQVQKTHSGPRVTPTTGVIATTVSYQTDTTGGNSGSPVEDTASGLSIGIHTHAGCSATAGNNGTMITHSGLATYLAGPLSVCLTGRGTAGGDLFAAGDAVNNFGTLSTSTGNFAKVADGPARIEGVAYNPAAAVFYVSTNDTFANVRRLYSIAPSNAAPVLIGAISGTTSVINGLAFDPASGTLYGIAQATGQLFIINTSSAAATLVGAPGGGTVGGIDFDATTGTLYGVDDSAGTSKLVTINTSTGAQTLVGLLGAGIADCNGLGAMADGTLFTINAATRQLLRINPQTGAATVVGATGGVFGASYGLGAVIPPVSVPCYANCDNSTVVPVLNVGDFTCFLQRFAAGESYANCDNSNVPPVLNVGDFTCFLQLFATGCP